MQRPTFIKPGQEDTLYPVRNKDGIIETLINPNSDAALTADSDASSNFVYNRYHHLPINTQRQKLPVFQYRNHILYLLEKYQTLVLIGETGCGKSTQVPQGIIPLCGLHKAEKWTAATATARATAARAARFPASRPVPLWLSLSLPSSLQFKCQHCVTRSNAHTYLHEIGHRVCVTQPRVTATVSLATRVASELNEDLGERVGFAAGMTSVRKPESGIVYMTEGVLLREMFANPLLMQYTCIMLDEVHERSLMTDVLMGLLKKIAKKRKNLKLVISSATMDAEFLRDFFNLADEKKKGVKTSVIMSMQGRTHPIDVYYSEEPVADYVKATVDTVIKIHENEPFGDVLAFLTSQEEIHAAMETLQRYAEQTNEQNKFRKLFPSGVQASDISILPMYGTLSLYRQIKVFQMADKNVRKVVLATNVAETSITVPGISYVIDCGFHKVPYFDPAVGVECLSVTAICKTNAIQRAGRAGRTSRGKCFRLYSEAEYENLPASLPPEMCRSDLSAILLQLKALGIHNLLRFTFPTPPPAKNLLYSIETLYALKAIDKTGQLTDIGEKMAELPVRPMCAKMLVQSGDYGCVDEILSICAMLQVDSVFIKQSTGKNVVAAKVSRRNNFEVAEGDIIMYLNIFDSYMKVKNSAKDERKSHKLCKDWCQKMFLNYRVMEKAYEIRSSLEKLIKNKFEIQNQVFEGLDLGSEKLSRIMKCIISGYFAQAAYLTPAGHYRGIRNAELHISPDSVLFAMQQPQWVIFASVQSTLDKTYMREILNIKKEWLLEVAPHYYSES